MPRKSAASAAGKAEMIRALFENSGDLMHVVSADGRLKLVNPAWKAVLGWDEADVIGTEPISLTHPDDDPEGTVERLRALAPGGVAERYVRFRTKAGDYRWFAARTQKMPDGDYIG